ncbi:MAG: MOP flippase family protein [Acidobacteriaceae bacterium]|nr:MOP flippase family protein [Acidobacteriaceae bacterium]
MPTSNQTSETTLTQRAVSGTAWSTMSTAGRQLLSLASIATVARLLGPGAYGVMGMANLLIVFILNFRDLGTGTAIVQRLSVSRRLLSSLFWVNFFLGIVLALIVTASSPLVAAFFKTPALVPILSTLSLSFWLTSCGVVPNSILVREMRFKSIAGCDVTAALASYVVALSFALSGFGVWSLVFANLANSFTATALYWLASSWRPRREFDGSEVKSVLGFSLHLSGFGVVNYFARNADNITVGKVLGQAQLGNYQMAYNMMLQPIQNISSVMAQVTLPAFAQIQNDNGRFRQAYVRSSMLIGLITFPVMAGLGVVADPLIRAVLGSKWLGAIAIFQVLAPVGLVQSVQTTVGQIYVAKGKTDWMFRWGVASSILYVTSFLIGVRYGAIGVAAAYGIVYLGLLTIPNFLIPFSLIGLKLTRFAAALLPQLLVTAAMVIVCGLALHGLGAAGVSSQWVRLICTSACGSAFYIGAMIVFRPPVMDVMEQVMGHSRSPVIARALGVIRALDMRSR